MNTTYVCPMHPEVRRPDPGMCPRCRMALVPEGARFGMLRHMMSMPKHMLRRPWMLALMVVAMAIMAAMMTR